MAWLNPRGVRLPLSAVLAPSLAAALLWGSSAAAQTQEPYGGSGGLQSGGLAPPGLGSPAGSGAYDPNAPAAPASDKEAADSGRGLEFVWLNAEAGYQILGLQTLRANNLVDAGIAKTSQNGPVIGAAVGLRFVFLTLGARFRLAKFDQWQVWTVGPELGLRIPLGNLEPHFMVGGGYASLGTFDAKSTSVDLKGAGVQIHGWNVRAGFGLDYYVTPVVSFGALATGDMLFLTRPGVSPSKLASAGQAPAPGTDPAVVQAQAQTLYAADGSSMGTAATLTAVVGLHF